MKWLELKAIVICLKLRAKLCFYGFLCFFVTYSHKVVQTWFNWHEAWNRTPFDILLLFEMVRIENNSHMLETTCLVSFLRFISFFGTYSPKVVQTWFVLRETWHKKLICIYYYIEIVRN